MLSHFDREMLELHRDSRLDSKEMDEAMGGGRIHFRKSLETWQAKRTRLLKIIIIKLLDCEIKKENELGTKRRLD